MRIAPDFDPLGPAMLADPYPAYARLQAEHPVFWYDKMGAWVVTRYADCRAILMDADLFVRDPRRVGEVSARSDDSIQRLDVERQSALRRLLVNSIHTQDLDRLGHAVRASIDAILARVADRASFDWMTEVAAPLAATITAEFLGVREPDPAVYKAIVEGMARKFDSDLDEDGVAAADRIRRAFGALVDGWLGADDTHGTVLSLKEGADRLGIPLPLIRNSVGLLFNGSYGTIFASSGNVAHRLMTSPRLLAALRDPALLSTGVDELVRFDGPTLATSRVATRRTEVRGVEIAAGDPMFVVLGAANRDPDQFPRADEIVLERRQNKHLGFGWGSHSCVGSLFGQLALRELIGALQDAPHPLRPTGTPVWLPTATIRSIVSLPVTFRP